MTFEGKIALVNNEYDTKNVRLMVDAEPHVMQRLRKIFDNSQNFWQRGEYTHKPITFSFNMNACRDLAWIMDRYNLFCEPDLLAQITEKAKAYDDVVKFIATADKDGKHSVSDQALPLALPIREHQVQFSNMFKKVRRMLLADKMGLGKTVSAISILQEPEARPAIIVVPPHLCTQWEKEINRFLPGASTHVIRGFKNYPLPQVDVLITSYNRLAPWQDVLISGGKFKTLIMDEVHELRHTGTAKRRYCEMLSENVFFCLGLSGTPIFNQGSEIWSVLDTIKTGCLGTEEEFNSEWCSWGKVYEPASLHKFLKSQGLMLRRTPEEIGMSFGEASKHVYTIDSDLEKLKEVQNVAKMLAMSVLSGNINEQSDSAREFDWKLRHATGVAKAKPVAEFVKMLTGEGEKVLLAGWHRDVYDIWEKEFKDQKMVMYTGTESVKEKDAAVKAFVEGDANIFVISLRSGAGLDGLQRVCSHVVMGEMDWSPHVMDQIVARLDRDGQTKHVQAYYLTITDGSDPIMVRVLSGKRSQHDGVIEGKVAQADVLETTSAGKDRIREMAEAYLTSIGEEIPEAVVEEGLCAELSSLIRTIKLPSNNEEEMQDALNDIFKQKLDASILVEKEFKISARSRLDFMVSKGDEKIAIECKIESTDRKSVYRQVRRYVEEGGVKAVILIAPWHGIPSFKVDETPVIVIDTSINSI